MDKIKIGLIGAGGWGLDHAKGYSRVPNAEMVAVADVDKSRADALAADFAIPRSYGSIEELLKDDSVEAVSIVIPNKYHAHTAMQALEAGKPVMLDKPFAMNAAEAQQVLKTAKRKGLLFIMGMNQRFDSNTQVAKSVLDRGEAGEIYHAKAYWLRRNGIPGRSPWFATKELSGGGPMIDLGVHMLDLSMYLMDNFEPVTVSASVYDKIGPRLLAARQVRENSSSHFDVEDFATALIRMKNGATLQLEASWVLHMDEKNHKNVQLFGTEGGLNLNPPRFSQMQTDDSESISSALETTDDLPFPHCSRYQHYVDVLQGKAEQIVKWEQSLAVQRILDAVYESARLQREIEL